MRLLDRLQRRFGRFAVPHLTEGLIACQVVAYFFQQSNASLLSTIALVPRRVLEGEVWRLFTFLGTPPLCNPLFAFFFWYMFYLMGAALEHTWSEFRYNVYLLVGWAATVVMSFLQPDSIASIGFLQGSVFLAFAYLYPDFQILFMFILPVKMKWMAVLTWLYYLVILLLGDVTAKLLILASVCNFVLFFWSDILSRLRSSRRRMARQTEQSRAAKTPRHVCSVCGADNLRNPELSFRYCSKCVGSPCYCDTHLREHQHIVAGPIADKDNGRKN
ncbi:MAG: hypothetical protein ABFC54_02560 [Thermoguttaceae bacterium]